MIGLAPGILAPFDGHLFMGREPHEVHLERPGRGPGPGLCRDAERPARQCPDRHRDLGRQIGMTADRIGHLHRAHPHDPVYPTDHHLRRVDKRGARGMGVAVLARGEGRLGKGVGPADIVPVIDMQRQRDHVLAGRQFPDHRIGGRTGRTTLRGEKLHHHRPALRGTGPGHQGKTQAGGQGRKNAHGGSVSSVGWWATRSAPPVLGSPAGSAPPIKPLRDRVTASAASREGSARPHPRRHRAAPPPPRG